LRSGEYETKKNPFRQDNRNGDRYGGGGRGGYDDRGGGRGRNDDRGPPRRGRFNDGRENPRPSNCLGIFGMSVTTNEEDVRKIFERYGRVDSVKIIMDRETNQSRGFGFVNFEERSDAARALEKIADTKIDGMQVRVDFAIRRRSPPPHNRSPIRSGGGDGGSRRYSRSPVRHSRSP